MAVGSGAGTPDRSHNDETLNVTVGRVSEIGIAPGVGRALPVWGEDARSPPMVGSHTDGQAARGGCIDSAEVATKDSNRAWQAPVLSIVLATINERDALPELIRRLDQLRLPSYELVIADDGSTDGTREYLQALVAKDSRVRLLLHSQPRTLIPAQSEAVEAARGDFVVIMDADLQHPPEKIPELYRQLVAGARLVIASRYQDGGSTGQRSYVRGAISRGAELIAKVVIGDTRGLKDPLSGFYAFRRDLYRRPNPMHKGYHMLPYLLMIGRDKTTKEVPYSFGRRVSGRSKVTHSFGFVFVFLKQMWVEAKIPAMVERSARVPGQTMMGHDSGSSATYMDPGDRTLKARASETNSN